MGYENEYWVCWRLSQTPTCAGEPESRFLHKGVSWKNVDGQDDVVTITTCLTTVWKFPVQI